MSRPRQRANSTWLESFRKTVADTTDFTTSYRVFYNLACIETRRTRLLKQLKIEANYDAALEYLRLAMRAATRDEKDHLRKWADKDPSLPALKSAKKGDFTKVLAGEEIKE